MCAQPFPDIVVTNLHRRYTGVSATVKTIVPIQQSIEPIAVLDSGDLGLDGTISIRKAIWAGWSKPQKGKYRIWHARRDVEMLLGLFLKYILRQRWKLVFTSAAPKRHGRTLRFIMNRMDAIIATSGRSASFLDWHTEIVTHGVDTDTYQPADKSKAKAELGFSKNDILIGNFGRIRKSKGTDILVDALISVSPKIPSAKVVITGAVKANDDAFYNALLKKISDARLKDQIVFMGDTDFETVKKLYQACDLCVAASRTEGFGLTPLEAMASGTAVLTTDAGFWPELIIDDSFGRIVKSGDREALTHALRDLLSEPARLAKLGRNARRYCVEHHAINVEVDGIMNVYAKLR